MNWRAIGAFVAVILLLMMIGPRNAATFLQGIAQWVQTFFASFGSGG